MAEYWHMHWPAPSTLRALIVSTTTTLATDVPAKLCVGRLSFYNRIFAVTWKWGSIINMVPLWCCEATQFNLSASRVMLECTAQMLSCSARRCWALLPLMMTFFEPVFFHYFILAQRPFVFFLLNMLKETQHHMAHLGNHFPQPHREFRVHDKHHLGQLILYLSGYLHLICGICFLLRSIASKPKGLWRSGFSKAQALASSKLRIGAWL